MGVNIDGIMKTLPNTSPLKQLKNESLLKILEKYKDYIYLSGGAAFSEFYQKTTSNNFSFNDFDFFFINKPGAQEKYEELVKEINKSNYIFVEYQSTYATTCSMAGWPCTLQFIKPDKDLGMNHFDIFNTRFFSTYPFNNIKKHKSIENISDQELCNYLLVASEVNNIYTIKRLFKYNAKGIKLKNETWVKIFDFYTKEKYDKSHVTSKFYEDSEDDFTPRIIDRLVLNSFLDTMATVNHHNNSYIEKEFFNNDYKIYKQLLDRNHRNVEEFIKTSETNFTKKLKSTLVNKYPEYFI